MEYDFLLMSGNGQNRVTLEYKHASLIIYISASEKGGFFFPLQIEFSISALVYDTTTILLTLLLGCVNQTTLFCSSLDLEESFES